MIGPNSPKVAGATSKLLKSFIGFLTQDKALIIVLKNIFSRYSLPFHNIHYQILFFRSSFDLTISIAGFIQLVWLLYNLKINSVRLRIHFNDLINFVSFDSDSKKLFRLSQKGVELVVSRSQQFCLNDEDLSAGLVRVSWLSRRDLLQKDVEYMNNTFNTSLVYWPEKKVKQNYLTNRYNDAIFDPQGYQINPLN